ncbi:MAG: DUF6361 family protein [Acidimicrobiia bacterium]
MASVLNWLDVSEEQQRRIREIVKMFEDPGTRDELGIGQVRDAFSNTFFPGMTTVMTRARYFLFVPWHFEEARKRGLSGQALLDRANRTQRRFISKFIEASTTEGLIGVRAGEQVKILPSTIYWGGLVRLGILAGELSASEVARTRKVDGAGEADELADRTTWLWRVPPVPNGFPDDVPGGFDLTYAEADWLRERITDSAPGTLLRLFVDGPPIVRDKPAWLQPAIGNAPPELRNLIERGRRFSAVMEGAALVHNLLLARAYDGAGFTRLESQVATYETAISSWADEVGGDARALQADLIELWATVAAAGSRVAPLAKEFITSWIDLVAADPANASGDAARQMIDKRVRRLRGPRSFLGNPKLLAQWNGATGADPLDYRWGTVRRLIEDIQKGLGRAGT